VIIWSLGDPNCFDSGMHKSAFQPAERRAEQTSHASSC